MNAKLQLIQNEYSNHSPNQENDQKRSTSSTSSLTFDKLLKEIEVVRRQVPEICSQYSHQFLSSSSLSLNQNQENQKEDENEKSQNLSRSSPIDSLLISFLSTVTCHLISSVDRLLCFLTRNMKENFHIFHFSYFISLFILFFYFNNLSYASEIISSIHHTTSSLSSNSTNNNNKSWIEIRSLFNHLHFCSSRLSDFGAQFLGFGLICDLFFFLIFDSFLIVLLVVWLVEVKIDLFFGDERELSYFKR